MLLPDLLFPQAQKKEPQTSFAVRILDAYLCCACCKKKIKKKPPTHLHILSAYMRHILASVREPYGTFPDSHFGSTRFCERFHGCGTRFQRYHFSICFDEGPSKPKRVGTRDVAMSRALIGFLTKIESNKGNCSIQFLLDDLAMRNIKAFTDISRPMELQGCARTPKAMQGEII